MHNAELLASPVVSAIIQCDDGRILLQVRNKISAGKYRGYYELPQGRLRRGETLLDCLCREVYEETGLTEFKPKNNIKYNTEHKETLISLTSFIVNMTGTQDYLAIAIVGTAKGTPRDTDEATGHVWCSTIEVEKLLLEKRIFPLNIPMLKEHFQF